ncbi:MAG: OPT/YSL family transporter, partial [Puniceicoccales bacterium]|nr:OPT/YSL family transporter [Puniceicoccales bacterium]
MADLPDSTVPPATLPEHASVEQRDAHWRAHIYRGDKEPQLTWRAAWFGGFIGILACASSLYTSLTIGWAFGVNITACIISYVAFTSLHNLSRNGRVKAMGVLENSASASVASVAGMTPSHTVVGAFGGLMLLGSTQGGMVGGMVPWYYMVPTVLFSALLGSLIAVPLKRSVINVEQLKFPSSIAFAETMKTLYAHGQEAVEKARCLLFGMATGALLGIWKSMPDLAAILKKNFGMEWFDTFVTKVALPELVEFQGPLNPLNWWQISNGRLVHYGMDVSLLLIGAGMIVGLRVSLSMLGTALLLHWVVAPALIVQDKIHAADPAWIPAIKNATDGATGITTYRLYEWSLWCGTSIMVVSGLTALAMQWPVLVRAFRGIFSQQKKETAYDVLADVEVPMRWFAIGIVPVSLGLIVTLWLAFEIAPWLGLIAVLMSFVTGLICTRTAGEADVNPVGAMGKVTQLLYSVLPGAKGNASVNLLTAGMTATAGGSAADLSADMKVGYLLGMNPRQQFWTQIIGVFIGTIVVVPIWTYLVPSREALELFHPPAAIMWKTVAEFLTNANSALPYSAKASMVVGALIGVVLPLLERALPRRRAYLPSAMGVGLAMVLPSGVPNSLAFAIGAVIMWFWTKCAPRHNDKYGVPLASGFVAGESLAMAGMVIAATFLSKL